MITIARIKQIVDGLLAYVEYDYETVPEDQTLLYHMFYGTRDGVFDFYEQAKEIFLRKNTSPRKITTRMEYPRDKSHMPCIIIREPGRGYGEVEPLGGFGDPTGDLFGSTDYQREGFIQSSLSTVNMMCFSDNMLESTLIGEVLFTLLVGARNTLEQEFTKYHFSTNELVAENALFPTPILIKNISVEIEDTDRFASIIRPELIRSFIIEDAIPVGTDPNWTPPSPEKYFVFAHPYLWLEPGAGVVENTVFSNTDWVLALEGEELFSFGSSYLWLDELTNQAEQEINSKVKWRLE